jgi:hypothetical protein
MQGLLKLFVSVKGKMFMISWALLSVGAEYGPDTNQ